MVICPLQRKKPAGFSFPTGVGGLYLVFGVVGQFWLGESSTLVRMGKSLKYSIRREVRKFAP
jgi:hypothetical protein